MVYTTMYIRRSVWPSRAYSNPAIRQAVRFPKAFRVKSKEVEIFRRGDEIVLREKKKSRGMADAYEALMAIPLDAFEDIKDTRPPEEREGF
jgi:antitoxin VapB